MGGCLRAIGCLTVLAVIAIGGWFFRDTWLPYLPGRASAEAPTLADATWEPVTSEAARRGRTALEDLSRPSGEVFVSLSAADLASYILQDVIRQLPPSAENIEASVVGDRVYLRASVSLAEMGEDVLGPLRGMLSDRETLLFGGTIEIVRPGLAQFRVADVKVRDFSLPSIVIPRLLDQVRGDSVPAGVADDAIAADVPTHIGDVRVSEGRVTVYRTPGEEGR